MSGKSPVGNDRKIVTRRDATRKALEMGVTVPVLYTDVAANEVGGSTKNYFLKLIM